LFGSLCFCQQGLDWFTLLQALETLNQPGSF
jgi:hypothetical protein